MLLQVRRFGWHGPIGQSKFAKGVEQPAKVVGAGLIANPQAVYQRCRDVQVTARRLPMSGYTLPDLYRIPDEGLIQISKVNAKFIIGCDPRKSVPDRPMKTLASGLSQSEQCGRPCPVLMCGIHGVSIRDTTSACIVEEPPLSSIALERAHGVRTH
jgi:hypothetical protein